MTSGTKKRKRGSALVAVMMVIAMLMAVVLAISHFQAVARQTYMTEEASLRFREGARFEIRRQLLNVPPPSDLIVTATSANVTPAGTPVMAKLMAQNIFDRKTGLPDLKSLETSPAHTVLKFTPSTPDVGLRVFGSNTYTMVLTNVPGYAAYAPLGSVKITNMESWANPSFNDARKTLEAYSGVMAVVAAKKDATIANVTYGEAHVIDGIAKIDHGNGVAYKQAKFPLPLYSGQLVTELKAAREALIAVSPSGDKTSQIYTGGTAPEKIIKLFFGGESGLEGFVSLSNANHFWLPTIPFFSSAPPYLYSFAFHLPYPADNANYSTNENLNTQVTALNLQIKDAAKKMEDAAKALDAAKQAYQQNSSDSNLLAMNNAQALYDSAKGTVENLNQQMQSLFGPQKAAVDAQIQSTTPRGVPLTRSQDPDGDEGVTGWSYSSSGNILTSLLGFLFGGFDIEKIAATFGNPDVKFVHFGSKDREFKFVLDGNNMGLDATLTVPRGRTLKLTSPTITIAGDLWLQRGSTFYADCDKLSVVPGRGSNPAKFFSPCGRIFMEEGSTLVCRGEVECVGSAQWGSVVVGGVPGKIHPITAGIFANKVTLNNGIFAGCAIDDLVEGLGDLFDSNTLRELNDKFMRPLIADVAPNAAKVLGPFWPRKPYFAKYATTFQIICPPLPPFGEPGPPIPTPIPLPVKNVLIPIERALSYVFSVSLNMGLGENFYTHADWWIFGEGVVPMVPQVDPNKIKDKITGIGSSIVALDPATIVTKFIEKAVQDMVGYVVESVIKQVVAKVVAAAIPYAGLADFATSLLTEVSDNLTNRDSARDSAGSSLTSALTDSVAGAGKATLDNLSSMFSMSLQDQFLREYNGVLVYADDSINISGRNATGMFVAGGKLTVTASQCVGTLLSTGGDIECTSLLYYPYFNQASLYVPKETAGGLLGRAKEFLYDKDFASSKAVDVGPPSIPPILSAQGWAQ